MTDSAQPRPSRSPPFRRTAAVLALPLLAAVLVYLSAPRLVAWQIAHRLQEAGLQDVHLEAGYPGPDALLLHRLRFAVPFEGHRLEVDADTVRVAYRLPGLLRGRVLSVQIGPWRAAWVPSAGPAPPPAPPPLPGPWIRELPFESVSLATGSLRAGDRRWDLDAEMAAAGGRLALQAHIRGAPAARLSAELLDSGRATLVVGPAGREGRPALRIVLDGPSPARWTLQVQGRLAPLLAWLTPLADWPLKAGTGEIELDARSDATGISGRFAFQAGALTWPGRAEDLALSGAGRFTGRGARWRLHWERLRIAGRWPRGTVPARGAVQLTAPLTMEWTGQAQRRILRLPGGVSLAGEALHYGEWRADRLALRGGALELGLGPQGDWSPARPWGIRLQVPVLHGPAQSLGRLGPVTARLVLRRGTGGPARLVLETAEAGILGGTVGLARLPLWPLPATARTRVGVAGLDLARLVALEQRPDLEASGRLDGVLPLVLTPEGPRIAGGRLAARPPGGVIRFRAGAAARGAAANAQLAMTYRILEDFHYRHLAARVDYTPRGDLLLEVRLRGRNPAYAGGRPVHLNLTVQENVPALLRSLGLAGELSGRVEERVRRHYQRR